jgi:hypothetical protein
MPTTAAEFWDDEPLSWSDHRDLPWFAGDPLWLTARAEEDTRVGATIREADLAVEHRRDLRGGARARRSCVADDGDSDGGAR